IRLAVTLQRDHAPDDPRFEVHHAIGVGEITRQLRVSALDDAGAKSQIARLERCALRPALLFPQLLAAGLPEFGGVAVLQRGAGFCDLGNGADLARASRSAA